MRLKLLLFVIGCLLVTVNCFSLGEEVYSQFQESGGLITTINANSDLSLGDTLTVDNELWVNGSQVTAGAAGQWTDQTTYIEPTNARDVHVNQSLTVSNDLTIDGVMFGAVRQHLYLTLDGNQSSGIGAGDEIAFKKNLGNMTHNDTTHVTTLLEGITYRITFPVFLLGSANTMNCTYQCWNNTDNVSVGPLVQQKALTSTSNTGVQSTGDFLLKPTKEIEVEFRLISVTSLTSVVMEGTNVTIVEIHRE